MCVKELVLGTYLMNVIESWTSSILELMKEELKYLKCEMMLFVNLSHFFLKLQCNYIFYSLVYAEE